MPTYEYSCEKCGKNFDVVQSMRDEQFRECPKELCQQKKWGHGKVKRLLGAGAGLIFKGSGFYITDYRSDSYKEAAKKDAPAVTPATDSKTATTKEGASAPPAKSSTPSITTAKPAESKPKKSANE
ncbi:MAG: FmdB family zinc ribbon protein [Chthoniobacterales bacterium]